MLQAFSWGYVGDRMNLEHRLQAQYAIFLDSLGVLYCASSGGVNSSRRAAGKMKRAGYKRGFPDIFIYHPAGKYHGMSMELKVKTKKTVGATPEQKKWRADLEAKGYYALIAPGNLDFFQARDWLEAETLKYLEGRA